MGKLPFIPDKKMYAAVMGACSYVRDTGYFNKATQYYADKYDVDVDEVRKYVRIAQGNGQKQAAKRKYYWFAVEFSMGNERNGCCYFEPIAAQYTVKKGLTPDSVQNSLSKDDDYFDEHSPCHWFGRIEQFETKQEAIDTIKKWRSENSWKPKKENEKGV